MPRPPTAPASITPTALARIVQHCRDTKTAGQGEACGLLFGINDVGRRAVAIGNVHPHRANNFAMDESEVIAAMRVADDCEEKLIAVWHSHPESAPIPSDQDKATPHLGPGSPAYVIVSLEDDAHPTARAWRMDLEFVGSPRATEVLLHISEDGEPFAAAPPPVPWALTPGNKVLLTYQRPGHPRARTITAEITGLRGEGTPDATLILQSRLGTDPKSMLVNRVKAAKVLAESPQAGRIRQRTGDYAAALARCLNDDAFTEATKYGAFLSAAFPTWLIHT